MAVNQYLATDGRAEGEEHGAGGKGTGRIDPAGQRLNEV